VSAAVSMGQQPASSAPQKAGETAGTAVAGANFAGTNASTNEEEEKRWQPVLALPCELTVDLELPGFKVSDLLKLGAGTVLGSVWPVRRDVPLRVNGTLIGWSEFEVVGKKLAVRLTELA
jgi:flagellar motor switch/type III secretory pathway protein FliN